MESTKTTKKIIQKMIDAGMAESIDHLKANELREFLNNTHLARVFYSFSVNGFTSAGIYKDRKTGKFYGSFSYCNQLPY